MKIINEDVLNLDDKATPVYDGNLSLDAEIANERADKVKKMVNPYERAKAKPFIGTKKQPLPKEENPKITKEKEAKPFEESLNESNAYTFYAAKCNDNYLASCFVEELLDDGSNTLGSSADSKWLEITTVRDVARLTPFIRNHKDFALTFSYSSQPTELSSNSKEQMMYCLYALSSAAKLSKNYGHPKFSLDDFTIVPIERDQIVYDPDEDDVWSDSYQRLAGQGIFDLDTNEWKALNESLNEEFNPNIEGFEANIEDTFEDDGFVGHLVTYSKDGKELISAEIWEDDSPISIYAYANEDKNMWNCMSHVYDSFNEFADDLEYKYNKYIAKNESLQESILEDYNKYEQACRDLIDGKITQEQFDDAEFMLATYNVAIKAIPIQQRERCFYKAFTGKYLEESVCEECGKEAKHHKHKGSKEVEESLNEADETDRPATEEEKDFWAQLNEID